MDGVRFERWSGGAGLGFVVLFMAGIVFGFGALASASGAVGASQPIPANAEQMVAVAREARIGVGASAYLLSLAAVLFVWFSSGVAVALRRGQDGNGGLWMLVFAGGLLYAAHLLGWTSVLMQAVFMATYVGDNAAASRTAVDVLMRGPYDKILWANDWMFPGILLLGGTGLSAVSSSALPKWLGRLSLWLAAALIVLAGVGYITLSPAAWFGFPLFLLVWVPWTSVILLRGAGRRASSTAGMGSTAPIPTRSA